MVEDVFAIENDVDHLKGLLYKYEYNMVAAMISFEEDLDDTQRELRNTELEIRNQLKIHGQLLKKMKKGTHQEILFRSVNDDILRYLNYNAVMLSMRESESPQSIGQFANRNIFPLMRGVNSSIDTLSKISDSYIDNSRAEMASYQKSTRFFAIIAFIFISISIVISIIYSYRVLHGLEETNDFFKSKSESNEMRIYEIQNNTIMGIADLVESRSGETGQHVKRTSGHFPLFLA